MYWIRCQFRKLNASHHDVVTLITIHSAKGTEQNVCYVANVTPGNYPHARAQGDFDDVEEERRAVCSIDPLK